jgi:hypothetical protein
LIPKAKSQIDRAVKKTEIPNIRAGKQKIEIPNVGAGLSAHNIPIQITKNKNPPDRRSPSHPMKPSKSMRIIDCDEFDRIQVFFWLFWVRSDDAFGCWWGGRVFI